MGTLVAAKGAAGDLSRALGWGLRFALVAALALAWQWLAHNLPSLLVPTLPETVEALGRRPAAGEFFEPYLSILLVTPMAALIPIIIMATGLGLGSRTLVVFTFALATITINTRAGVRMVEPGWIEMARAFGATERQLWRRVLLRGARPAVLMGLRLGLIRAVSGMVTMELLLVAVGVGRLINDFQGNLEGAEMYATVLVVVAEAVLLTQVFRKLEARAAPWADQASFE